MLHFFARRLKQLHEKDEKGEKGFTLIELLVVVIIIGILAAIAIPVFLNQRANAEDARAKANVREAASAMNVGFVATGSYPATIALLAPHGFNGSTPAVTGSGTGTGASSTFCVASVGSGSNSFKMTQADGAPISGTCP